ncbi:MAG: Ribosome-binding ATPase YchF [Lentisphaerae bacterium ADurb.BinA184]|nr:MAG: Ribosome-binding ATPase YchF [Lentisphaerae bacterium ADurb.BinA184]
MAMNLGLVGLPEVGKATIFRLLTGLLPEKAPNRNGIAYGIAPVRDPRVDRLVEMYHPKKMRYAEFEMALPPDVTPNAARSAEWIDPLRNVDAYLHVVRAFESPSVFHLEGSVDPARDVELVEMEFLLADMAMAEKRISRMAKEATKKTAAQHEYEEGVLRKCTAHLEAEKSLRTLAFNDEELRHIRSLQFLTLKPLVVVFNVGEDVEAARKALAPLAESLHGQGATVVYLSAAIESELCELGPAEREAFMADLGIAEPAAHRLSRAAYDCLGLISFFTVGEDEVRAWPARKGTLAPEAAGKIHSDLERGFIRAETIRYDDLVKSGSEKAAKEANLQHVNGKEYVVQDGDVLHIRFNV